MGGADREADPDAWPATERSEELVSDPVETRSGGSSVVGDRAPEPGSMLSHIAFGSKMGDASMSAFCGGGFELGSADPSTGRSAIEAEGEGADEKVGSIGDVRAEIETSPAADPFALAETDPRSSSA